MALPRKLKHLNLFGDSQNWIGVAEEFTPPNSAANLKNTVAAACQAPLISIWGWMMTH